MVDRALAKIPDELTREAVLEIRAEFYAELRSSAQTVSQLATAAAATSAALDKHSTLCAHEQTQITQWRESLERVLEEFKETITEHVEADERYQDKMDKKFSGAMAWLIGIFASMLGGIGIAALTGHIQIH